MTIALQRYAGGQVSADMRVDVGQAETVIGSGGIGVALLSYRRQLNGLVFIAFPGRCQRVLRLFPAEAWLARATLLPGIDRLHGVLPKLTAALYQLLTARYIPKPRKQWKSK
jgi:hypothetical protein